ncbi:bifunctional diguanylate cyclase/phosphodiesterase [Halomonas llamarensis]|uniref:EAL domain-containing protein n=1 Tax=Halomonas llamarensis TaxID=2945104 RepID=A0ABT0SN02_9GAMM|nr:EAL domain-containing protein [Halomonas llamarensis]MCL7929183.1 EAL domain-containing protein [Halomonas llamarensis]
MPDSPETLAAEARLYRRLRVNAIAIYVFALIAMAVIFTWLLSDQYHQEIDAAHERNSTRADLIAEWVNSTFALSEYALRDIAQRLEPPLLPRVGEYHNLKQLLVKRRDSLPLVSEIVVIDEQGSVLISSNAARSAGFDVSDMPFFRAFKQNPPLDDYVTPLFWSAVESDYLMFHARRLRGVDGHFEGLVAVRIDPQLFDDTLQRLTMRRGESMAIMDNDGKLLARRPDDQVELGELARNDEVEHFLASDTGMQAVRMHSLVDGKERLYRMQYLDNLPFAVVVGDSIDALLAPWRQRLIILMVIAAIMTLLGIWFVRHYLNRLSMSQQLHTRVLEREEARAQVQMREARLDALVRSIQDMIFVFDEYGRFTYIHALDEAQLLRPHHEAIGLHYSEVLPEAVVQLLTGTLYRVQHKREIQELEYSLQVNAQIRYFNAILSPLADATGLFNGVLVAVRDVTQAKINEAELRIAATAFKTHLGMIITDARGRILKVNDTFTRITGYEENEVLGENPRIFSSGRHDAEFYQQMWSKVKETGSWEGEIWNRRKNGQVFPEWLTISAVSDEKARLTHYVATLNDITESKAAEQEIHQLAFYDPLTGLANRRLFLDRMAAALKDSERHAQHGVLLFIDLDNFKQVNDTLGHYAGDQLLQNMARELSQMLRDTDTLARLGGDEFAVLIHALDRDVEQAARLAEGIALKLLTAIRRPIDINNETVLVTGSIGITLMDNSVDGVDDYLQQADMALFQAKEAGRDTLSFFDPGMQAALVSRARLEKDLRQALANDEWRLLYQPQVDNESHVTGVEALLRWHHPERGIVSPGDFIPLLESTRLINIVGAWVLETACKQLVEWQHCPDTAHLTVAVNISPVQFREDNFVPKVKSILRRTGAPADKLKLEVTETLFVEAQDDTQRKMEHLRAQGIHFSLDDFGTGYSSLAYLAHLPLDQLKIDQSFVRQVLDSPANAAIVESTIALARSLGLSVIAEGVETKAHQDWLARHACHAFQGFLFGRPMAVKEVEAML